jgi:hypothetical protein
MTAEEIADLITAAPVACASWVRPLSAAATARNEAYHALSRFG